MLQKVDKLIDEILTVIPRPPKAIFFSNFGDLYRQKYGENLSKKVKDTPTLNSYKTLKQFFEKHSAMVACITFIAESPRNEIKVALTHRGVERLDKATSTPEPPSEPELKRAVPPVVEVAVSTTPIRRVHESPTDQLVDKLIGLIPELPDTISIGELTNAAKATHGCEPTFMLRLIPQLGGCSLIQFLTRHPAMSSFVEVSQAHTKHAHRNQALTLVNLTVKGVARAVAARNANLPETATFSSEMELPSPSLPTSLTRAHFANRLRSLIPPPTASTRCSVLHKAYLEQHGSSLEDDLETVASTRELLNVIGPGANTEISASVVISTPAVGTLGETSVSLSPLGVQLVLEQHAAPDSTFPVTTFNVKVTAVNPGKSLVADDCVYCPWNLLHNAADWAVGDMISISAFYFPESSSGSLFRACSFAVRGSSGNVPPLPLPVKHAPANPSDVAVQSAFSATRKTSAPKFLENIVAEALAPKGPTPLGHPGNCSACIKWSMIFSEKKNAIYFTCANQPAKWQKSLTEGDSFVKPVGCSCGCPRMSIPPALAKQQLATRNTNDGWPSTPPLSPGPPQMTINRISNDALRHLSSVAGISNDAHNGDADNSNTDDDDDILFLPAPGRRSSGGSQNQAEWTAKEDEALIAVVRARGSELSAQYAVPKHLEEEVAEAYNARKCGPARSGLTLAKRWKETLRVNNCQNIDMFSSSQCNRRPSVSTADTPAAPKPQNQGHLTHRQKSQVSWDDDQSQRLQDLAAEHMKRNGTPDWSQVTQSFNILQDADKHRRRSKDSLVSKFRSLKTRSDKTQPAMSAQPQTTMALFTSDQDATLEELVSIHTEWIPWDDITSQYNMIYWSPGQQQTKESLQARWDEVDPGGTDAEQLATPLPTTPSKEQHYAMLAARDYATSRERPRRGWTKEEDEELTRLVRIHGVLTATCADNPTVSLEFPTAEATAKELGTNTYQVSLSRNAPGRQLKDSAGKLWVLHDRDANWTEVHADFNVTRVPEMQRTLQGMRTRWKKGRVGSGSAAPATSTVAEGSNVERPVNTWTDKEHTRLVQLVETYGCNWSRVSAMLNASFPNIVRLPNTISKYWITHGEQKVVAVSTGVTTQSSQPIPTSGLRNVKKEKTTSKRGKTVMCWTDDQHQRLASLIEKQVIHDWNAIHHDFNALQDLDKHRTKGSLREHWRLRGKQATNAPKSSISTLRPVPQTMSKAESVFSAVASSVSMPGPQPTTPMQLSW